MSLPKNMTEALTISKAGSPTPLPAAGRAQPKLSPGGKKGGEGPGYGTAYCPPCIAHGQRAARAHRQRTSEVIQRQPGLMYICGAAAAAALLPGPARQRASVPERGFSPAPDAS